MTLLEAVSPTARRMLRRHRPTDRERFDSAITRVAYRIGEAHRMVEKLENDDERLSHLYALGNVVNIQAILIVHGVREQQVAARNAIRPALETLAAFAMAWRIDSARAFGSDVALVWAERERQRALRVQHPEKYLVDMAHPSPDPRRKFRVLVEEIGEIADGIDVLERASRHAVETAKYDLQKEIIQVAAVCVAWLESEIQNEKLEIKNGGQR